MFFPERSFAVKTMESINPVFKMGAVLLSAVILTFNHAVILNLLVFAAGMVLILFFSRAEKRRLLKFLLPIGLIITALFITGYKNAEQTLLASFATGTHGLGGLASMSPVYTGLQLSTRVLAYVGLGLLFSLTTPAEDMVLSMMHQLRVKPKFAYGILAAFHLVPNIARELEDAKFAYKVRGISCGPFALQPFFAAMVNCIRWSENLAMAMESKGFDGDGKRTYARILSVRPADIIILIAVPLLVLLGTLFLKY